MLVVCLGVGAGCMFEGTRLRMGAFLHTARAPCTGCTSAPRTRRTQSRLALEWREWLTRRLMSQYFRDRSFYQLQAGQLVDNPDQRIAADVRWALGLRQPAVCSNQALAIPIDIISFSNSPLTPHCCCRWQSAIASPPSPFNDPQDCH